MIRKDSTSTKKITNPSLVNSNCSCPECDSFDCFGTRNIKGPCSCGICKNTETCLYYSNKSRLNTEKKINSTNSKKTLKNEATEKEIVHDLNVKKDSVTKKQSTSHKTTDNLTCDFLSKFENEQNETRVNDTEINYNLATANLTAQVMNVPYKDFKNSLRAYKPKIISNKNLTKYDILKRIKEAYAACSCKVCECISGKSTVNEFCKCQPCGCNDCSSFLFNDAVNFQSTDNCFCTKHIKNQSNENKFNESEICDCYPCDCIKWDVTSNKYCNCKPCQCVECKAMSIHLTTTHIVAPVVEDHQQNVCQCTPCNCIECGRGYGMSSSLMHEMSTGSNRHLFCHCENCLNEACEPDVGDSCKCRTRNKTIKKPVERDVYDYDIRTILTKKYSRTRNDIGFPYQNDNDRIAMFTTMPNQYPKYDLKHQQATSSKNIDCSCNQCECSVCDYNETDLNGIEPSKQSKAPIADLKYNARKCSQYDSQYCSNCTIDIDNLSRNVLKTNTYYVSNCSQTVTNTSKFEKYSSVKMIGKDSFKEICEQKSDSRVFCEKNMYTPGDFKDTQCRYEDYLSYSTEFLYPIKRAKLLTPSIIIGIEQNNLGNSSKSHLSNLDIIKLMPKKDRTIQNQSNLPTTYKNNVKVYNALDKSYPGIRRFDQEKVLVFGTQKISKVVESNNQCYNIEYKPEKINRINTRDFIESDKSFFGDCMPQDTGKTIKNYSKQKINIKNCSAHELLTTRSKNHISEGIKINLEMKLDSGLFNKNPDNEAERSSDLCINKTFKGNIFTNNDIVLEILKFISDRRAMHKINDEIHDDTLSDCEVNDYSDNYNMKHVDYVEENAANVYNKRMLNNIDKITVNQAIVHEDVRQRQVHDIVLSDPQFNVIQDRYEETRSIFNYTFKNKAHSVVNGEQFENHYESENNFLNLRLNYYKSAQKTLRNAKAYSIILLKILDKYEKANMEFESISKKLEIPSDLLVNDDFTITSLQNIESCDNNNNDKANNEINYGIKEKSVENVEKLHDSNLIEGLTTEINATTSVDNIKVKSEGIKLVEESTVLTKDINFHDIKPELNIQSEESVDLNRSWPIQSNHEHLKSTNGSCDSLKVSFMSLRRVSDHTVLVKWNLPQMTNDIHGYELQVDGRAVQKILSPSRNIAVVTCLPHSDKILLTIKTITSDTICSGHYPSATVIYCPRNK